MHTQHNKHKHASFLRLILSSGYNRCFLVGHDWGGIIAWLCAIHYPEMVTKLIVLNSPHPCVFTGKCPKHLTNRFLVLSCLPQRLCFGLRIINMICIIHNEILWLGPGNHGALPSICLMRSSPEEEVITGRLLADTGPFYNNTQYLTSVTRTRLHLLLFWFFWNVSPLNGLSPDLTLYCTCYETWFDSIFLHNMDLITEIKKVCCLETTLWGKKIIKHW